MTPSLTRIALALLAAGLVAFVITPGAVHARAVADDSSSARVSMDHWLTVRRAPPPVRHADASRASGTRRPAVRSADAGAAPGIRGDNGRDAVSGSGSGTKGGLGR